MLCVLANGCYVYWLTDVMRTELSVLRYFLKYIWRCATNFIFMISMRLPDFVIQAGPPGGNGRLPKSSFVSLLTELWVVCVSFILPYCHSYGVFGMVR
jgi:hypothetical protein